MLVFVMPLMIFLSKKSITLLCWKLARVNTYYCYYTDLINNNWSVDSDNRQHNWFRGSPHGCDRCPAVSRQSVICNPLIYFVRPHFGLHPSEEHGLDPRHQTFSVGAYVSCKNKFLTYRQSAQNWRKTSGCNCIFFRYVKWSW